jgi:hypothetical protein
MQMAFCYWREIKFRFAKAKTAFNKRRFFTSKFDLNLRKELVKCFIFSIDLYAAEAWTLRKVDHTYLESFEMWCWREEWRRSVGTIV